MAAAAAATATAASPRRRKEGPPRAYDVLPLSVVVGRRTETKITTRDWQRPRRGGGRQLVRREEGRPVVQQVLLRDEYYLRTREGRQVVELHSERSQSTLKKEGKWVSAASAAASKWHSPLTHSLGGKRWRGEKWKNRSRSSSSSPRPPRGGRKEERKEEGRVRRRPLLQSPSPGLHRQRTLGSEKQSTRRRMLHPLH